MMPPRYRGLQASDIPVAELASGGRAKVICGTLAAAEGPVRDIVTDPEFFDVMLPVNCTFTHDVKPGYTSLAYVLDGEAYFDDRREAEDGGELAAGKWSEAPQKASCEAENVVLYDHQGEQVVITSTQSPVRFLFLSGRRLREPVAWRGPVVMNTDEELRLAFRELQNGTFVKHP
jgi:redox-sensitive bicupin YhaK (pirin superfamily)